MVTTEGDNYGRLYFLTDRMTWNLDILGEVVDRAGIELEDSDT